MTAELSLALADSPRFAPLGDVESNRLDVRIVRGWRPEILQRALSDDMVAGGEGSLADHLYRIAGGDRAFTAFPLFVQRAFVARYLYRRHDDERDLLAGDGRIRIGLYSFNSTATVWLRHFLRSLGVDPGRVDLVVGSVDRMTDQTAPDLTGRLLDGDIDLLFSAETPAAVHVRALLR